MSGNPCDGQARGGAFSKLSQAPAKRYAVVMELPYRIGTGYDVHRFAAGRKLILGGVEIPHCQGLAGHSDADVLTHALADAILGALALPDIGHHFPDTDQAHRGMDSQIILAKSVAEASRLGYEVGNVDTTLIAEEPRIGPHIPAIKQCLAATLGLDPGRIGLKATTHEGLGSLGRAEGIAAHAAALLIRTTG